MTDKKRGDLVRAPGGTPGPDSFDDVVEACFPGATSTLDAVSAVLWSFECEGSIVDDDGPDTTITAWIPESSRNEAVVALNAIHGVTATVVRQRRVDWLQHYEQSLTPLIIGKRFIVAPRAELVEGRSRIPIIIPQEQAFGTGSHETTSMCIEHLESLDLVGKRGLDVGTGSGILAIAMAKLGATRVFAFDNDVETWGILDRNLDRNDVPHGRILHFFASADALHGGRFDVVTMNILPDVIVALFPHVVPVMATGSILIASGILIEQNDAVVASAADSSLTLERETTRGEWWAGLFRRT